MIIGGYIQSCIEAFGAERCLFQSNFPVDIRWKQAVDSFPDYGPTFGNPDFVRYAESYSAKGTRVISTDGLIPAIENAFKSGGVHVVAVPIDYTENTRVLVDELHAAILVQSLEAAG